MDYDPGYFDDETCRTRTTSKPIRAKSVTYVSGLIRNPCVRNGPGIFGDPGRNARSAVKQWVRLTNRPIRLFPRLTNLRPTAFFWKMGAGKRCAAVQKSAAASPADPARFICGCDLYCAASHQRGRSTMGRTRRRKACNAASRDRHRLRAVCRRDPSAASCRRPVPIHPRVLVPCPGMSNCTSQTVKSFRTDRHKNHVASALKLSSP